MKNGKNYIGFISILIHIANFEVFLRNLNLSTNRLFWRCVNIVNTYLGIGQDHFVFVSSPNVLFKLTHHLPRQSTNLTFILPDLNVFKKQQH